MQTLRAQSTQNTIIQTQLLKNDTADLTFSVRRS